MFWKILLFSITFYIHGSAMQFDIGINVDRFLKERQPELGKLCENELDEYTWKSPTGKLFHFKSTTDGKLNPIKQFDLISINNIPVWVMDKNPAMDFRIIPILNKISLSRLYPTYPKFTGVDAFQFLMSLAHACQFSITLFDGSHISEPYKLIFSQGYYEQLIQGPSSKFYLTSPIKKDDFLKCIHTEVSFLDIENNEIYETILKNLDTCHYFGKSDESYIKHCPIHYPWLLPRLFRIIFSNCAISEDDLFRSMKRIGEINPNNKFEILVTDLHRILNKKYRKKSLTYEEQNVVETPILKTKEKITTELKQGSVSKILEEAFTFCTIRLGKDKLTPFEIFKNIMQDCVPETTNFLFKYDCDSFKVISE